MRTTRKRVSELEVGDFVVGFGEILRLKESEYTAGAYCVWQDLARRSYNLWPADAEVTVRSPQPRVGDRVHARSGCIPASGELIATHCGWGWVLWDSDTAPLTYYLEELRKVD